MSTITWFQGHAFAWVLQTTWRGAVLAILILIAQRLLGRRLSPAWRHGLWLLLVARLLLPFSLPVPFSLFNISSLGRLANRTVLSAPSAPLVPSAVNSFPTAAATTSSLAVLVPAFKTSPVPPLPGVAKTAFDWFGLAAWVWLVGAAWFGLRMVWLNWRFGRRVNLLVEVSDPEALQLLRECASRLDIRRLPRLVETGEVDGPALFGLGGKLLLLPEGFLDRFSSAELKHVFLHELAHLKRRDLDLNWLVESLRTIHWFNPVLWFAFSRMRADREIAADALALAAGGGADGLSYGETILKILANLRRETFHSGAVGIAEDRTLLAERIRVIASHGRMGGRSWAAAGAAIALAALGLTGQTASPDKVELQAQAEDKPAAPSPPTAHILNGWQQNRGSEKFTNTLDWLTEAPSKFSRTPELEKAVAILRNPRATKGPGSGWTKAAAEADQCVYEHIYTPTTELIPDLILIVKENPHAALLMQNTLGKYSDLGILNRTAYGMEYSEEFESFLRSPNLQTRLIGGFGMAMMDSEYAGPEALRTAIEGLHSSNEAARPWAGQIIAAMFREQFTYKDADLVSATLGLLTRLSARQGELGFGGTRTLSASDIEQSQQLLWAGQARACRERLKDALKLENLLPQQETLMDWASIDSILPATQARLGHALMELANLTPGPEGAILLAEAAAAYRAALESLPRESIPPLWAWYEDNLGLVRGLQSKQASGAEAVRFAAESAKAHRAALEAYPPAYDHSHARVSAHLREAERRLQKLKL